MTVSLEQVHAKARAFVDALCKLPSEYRVAPAGAQFGRDYNQLRELALAAAPGVDPRLWPAAAAMLPGPGGESCAAAYVEIETYARQIMEQLGLFLAPRPGAPAGGPADGAPSKTYDVGQIRERYGQAYQPWTHQDDEHLRACFAAGAPIGDLADELGRQPGAIRSRLRKLGLLD